MRYEAKLSTGVISVEIDHSEVPADNLFGFAERINPKRAFLFVSKVLGRHVPVEPSKMKNCFKLLSDKIPADLPGPILVIGMAETAIGLGAGVHMEYVTHSGRSDVAFLCTTRHDLGSEKLCTFSEDHSHATQHLIHTPQDASIRELVFAAKSLVLVDDEASTGNTFANLFDALPKQITDQIIETRLVTLTDWSDGAAMAKIPGNVGSISLVRGRYYWERDLSTEFPSSPAAPAILHKAEFKPSPSKDWGRLGVVSHPTILALDQFSTIRGTTLVLGTGEHVWEPYRLASELEAAGNSVFYASISRSPISVGHEIGDKTAFQDNYGLGVANYCYNLDSRVYDNAILCIETPVSYVDPILLNRLQSTIPNVMIVSAVDGVCQIQSEKELAA